MDSAYDRDFVAELFSALNNLETSLIEFLANNSEPETLCEVLAKLNEAKYEFGLMYDMVAAKTADAMGDQGELVLDDGVKIEKKWSSTRRGWQHKDLAGIVAHRLAEQAIDMETGEVIYSPEELARMMLDYVQPSYWKAKPVRELGIEVDNYCEVGETKTSLIVRKNK